MPVSQYFISWDSYKQSVSNGLSRLQRDGEFVDMTLAAEGHLVKVHQNLIALTSPYLKAMIQSASCQHPVIFLNNLNCTILGYILEYIYTGEVRVPADEISVFVDACRALHINGIEHFVIPQKPAVQQRVNQKVQPEIHPKVQPDTNSEVMPKLQPVVLHAEGQSDIRSEVQQDMYSEVLPELHSEVLQEVQSKENQEVYSEVLPESQPDIHSKVLPEVQPGIQSEVQPGICSEVQPDIHSEVMQQAQPTIQELEAQPEVHPLVSLLRPIGSQTEREMAENNFAAHITINSQNYNLEISTMNNNIAQLPVITDAVMDIENTLKHNDTMPISVPTNNIQTDFDLEIHPIVIPLEGTQSNIQLAKQNYSTVVDKQNEVTNLSDKEVIPRKPKPVLKFPKPGKGDKDQVFYTVSNRGSIQLILNRYIYCCHHQSKGGRLRRWRCINYRQVQCRAIIDTDNDIVINRSEDHCHPNHDNKILKKYKSKSVYTSISEAADAETFEINDKRNSADLWKPRTNNRRKKRNNCPQSMDLDGTDCN